MCGRVVYVYVYVKLKECGDLLLCFLSLSFFLQPQPEPQLLVLIIIVPSPFTTINIASKKLCRELKRLGQCVKRIEERLDIASISPPLGSWNVEF